MTAPDDGRKASPRERFRNILSAEQEDQATPEVRKPPVVNLPRVSAGASQQGAEAASDSEGAPAARRGSVASGFLPRLWTIGAILSVVANLVLMMLLISSWPGVGALSPGGSNGAALLGVYASLEQMDRAHIRTTIPIQTDVLIDASVPVKSSTRITLASDAFIQGAHVTIETAQFNIDAPANVTLPAGTELDAALDMNLPLRTNLPVAVDAPVDISVSDTELHAVIMGLQDSLRPLLCSAVPNAMLADGTPVCR